MVQDSLVEYISSQMKAGISRDAIKASLVGAGWQAADVEDTLKKVEVAGSSRDGAGCSAANGILAAALHRFHRFSFHKTRRAANDQDE
jgi:uncharacterized protein Smg (DUF494 family)